MGVLQRFERRLEGMVGSTFARLFKGKVHPAEIAKALQRDATEHKVVVGEGRVLVPNRYVVRLGPSDYDHLVEWEAELSSTMAEMVKEHIDAEGWSTFGTIQISLARDDGLRTGIFDVDSRVDADGPGSVAPPALPQEPRGGGLPPVPAPRPTSGRPPVPGGAGSIGRPAMDRSPAGAGVGANTPPRGAPEPSHALVIDGPNTRYELHPGSNVVGRGTDAAIRLADTGVSRRHFDVQLGGPTATMVDLGSTNGTIVNGRRIPRVDLADGDVIRVGHSVLVYRLERGGS